MRLIFLTTIASFFLGCRTTPEAIPDPIDRLVTELSAPHPASLYGEPWQNGMFPIINLPGNASPEEVVARVIPGQADRLKLLEIRHVSIGNVAPGLTSAAFIAVLVKENGGKKIVILSYEGDRTGWWSQVHDVKP